MPCASGPREGQARGVGVCGRSAAAWPAAQLARKVSACSSEEATKRARAASTGSDRPLPGTGWGESVLQTLAALTTPRRAPAGRYHRHMAMNGARAMVAASIDEAAALSAA